MCHPIPQALLLAVQRREDDERSIRNRSSDLERVLRAALGKTVKQCVDERMKKELLRILRGGDDRYGYQFARELQFCSDHAFYKWVKRVFGVTFNELREKYGQDGG